MFTKKQVGLLAAALASLTISGVAAAGTDTQNMAVSASISASCVFDSTNSPALGFGTLGIDDLRNGKDESSAASVKIICTNTGVAAKLYGAATRKMTDGEAGELNYQVYTDGARSAALGSDAEGGADVTADGTMQTITLYGKVASGQATAPAGAYSHNLQLTVEF